MKNFAKSMLFLLVAFAMTLNCFGSGFAIYEHGTKAMGMANAFTAVADDPSAVWYNPAGMTQLNGIQIYVGATGIAHQAKYYSNLMDLNYETDNDLDIAPHFYLTMQLTDNIWFGLGVNAPFGLAQSWPETSMLAYHTDYAKLQLIHISPAIAIKLAQNFSIGVGAHIILGNVKWERFEDVDALYTIVSGGAITNVDDLFFQADVSDEVVTFYGGILWDVTNTIHFGAVFHKGTDLEYTGDILFEEPTTGIASIDNFIAQLFPDSPDQGGTATIPVVDQLMLGLAFDISPCFTLAFDVDLTFWSQYESLTLDFDVPTGIAFWGTTIPIVEDLDIEKNWEDTICVRMGGNYAVNENIDLRFGVLYDTSPVPVETLDPMLPDNDRFGATIGFGYHKNGLVIDAAYMLLLLAEVDGTGNTVIAPLDQNYEAVAAHLFAVSVGYQF